MSKALEPAPVHMPTARTHPFDPPSELRSLREQQPLCRLRYPDGHVGWLVTSYALAKGLLADPRFVLRPLRPVVGDPLKNAAVHNAINDRPERAGELLGLDPPEHTRLRRALTGYFTVRRVGELRTKIERIVGERLDVMEQAGPVADLMEVFAQPVTSMVLCELLGAPQRDRDRFERPGAITSDPESGAEETIAAVQEFRNYARGAIEQRRVTPADDLLSELVGRGELSDDELAGVALQLFSGGHDSTASMLALGTFALLFDRRRWESLSADPSLLDTAIEELLRYLTIVQVGGLTRTALEDVELDGTLIKEGEGVTISLSAANRDPEKFADPDAFDLTRGATGHLAFGFGRHMCLGQHLARLEMEIGLGELIRRFPTLRLAVPPETVPLHGGERFIYSVRSLPVAW